MHELESAVSFLEDGLNMLNLLADMLGMEGGDRAEYYHGALEVLNRDMRHNLQIVDSGISKVTAKIPIA